MKVKILFGATWVWYKGLIGQELEIDGAEESLMWYIKSGEHKGRAIYKADVEIINGDKEMKFTKNMLTTGMRVVYNNGQVAIVLKDINLLVSQTGFNYITSLDDQLQCDSRPTSDWSVNCVYQGYTANADVLNYKNLGELLWERDSKTPEQIQLGIVMDKIAELQAHASELQKLVNK